MPTRHRHCAKDEVDMRRIGLIKLWHEIDHDGCYVNI